MNTLTFNCTEERNLVSYAIFKELISLRVKIDGKIANDEVFDGDMEEYNTLFTVYKNLNDLDSENLIEHTEKTIKQNAKERLEKKIIV